MKSLTLASRLLAVSALAFAAAPAFGAPPIAYAFVSSNGNQDLYLVNSDGSGKVLLYSAGKVALSLVDMDPSANRLVFRQSNSSGFKIIEYSSAGVRTNVTTVADPCQIMGLDFHPTDGSLLVSEYCSAQDVLQVRRWTNSGFDSAPLVTFGSGQDTAIRTVRWLGDGTGFLLAYSHVTDGVGSSRIQRHMLDALSSPVPIISFSTFRMPDDFDTARCTPTSTGPCWALAYDDGAGHVHKIHFDSMSVYEDSVQAGGTPHFSPNNSQLLYRLQTRPNFLLKIDTFSLVAKGNVGPGVDWRAQ